jgi:hypothetical protein
MFMKTKSSAILIAVGLMAFLPKAHAVSPPPDGCYPGFTTAEGCNALNSLTTGAGNTGVGWYSLFLNTSGNYNTGVGAGTLVLNNADSNTAVGAAALLLNTGGSQNVALGTDALVYNDNGTANSAVGAFALYSNTAGNYNTAIGNQALQTSMTADRNTAVGAYALESDDVGDRNTAIGVFALTADNSGAFNTAVGVQALDSNTSGNLNTALGAGAGGSVTTASNVICIGANVSGANVDNSCFIGNIFGATSSGGNAVFVNSNGRLGTLTSSKRFKEDITPMDKASEVILALRPVSFRYKQKIDPQRIPQFGLVAEEVEKVDPDLVIRDAEGKPQTVRYEQINAMLLNEFLKEHRKVEEQQATITELKSILAQQQKEFQATIAEQRKEFDARLKQQDARIQRVSDEVGLSKPAPQIVASDE